MEKNKHGKGYQKKASSKDSRQKNPTHIKKGKRRASLILVEKFKSAQEIHDKLKEGADFAELARKYSACPSKKNGSNFGSFPKGAIISEFWNSSIKLNINEISPSGRTRFGYHVIKRMG